MHGLAYLVVAAEGERQVADASAYAGVWQVLLYVAYAADEVESVTVVLRHARGYGEHVGVEDYVFGGEAVGCEQVVSPPGYLCFTLVGVGLSLFVEEHDYRRATHGAYLAGTLQKCLLSLLERYGVDDGFAAHAFHPRRNRLPRRRVDHERDAGYVGFRGEQQKKLAHGCRTVYHGIVHTYVEHLCSAVHLCARHFYGICESPLPYQTGELGRSCYIGSLAYVYEIYLRRYHERFPSRNDGAMIRARQRTHRSLSGQSA